jgi:Domain of unknown function (DUF4124)
MPALMVGAAPTRRYTAAMKLLRVMSLAAALLPALASAQWQWIDKDGRKVFSDRAPTADVPARNILKQPGGKPTPVPAEAEPSDSANAATVAKVAGDVPKISGKDKALEEKKKQAEQEVEAKKKAEDEKLAQNKAENCERAKRSLATMNSGVRVRVPNAKGELEFMSDETRASETKRLQSITAGCKS